MEAHHYFTYDRVTDLRKTNITAELPLRPGLSTAGKAIQVRLNQYKVTEWPQADVYQFDVSYCPLPHLQSQWIG